MKKIQYFFVLLLMGTITVISCQKEKAEVKDEQNNTEVSKITRQLQAFKQNLQLKSDETMTADSAEWYLEGLLNYEKANNTHDFGDVDFYHNTLLISVNNGEINLSDLNAIYTTINNWAQQLQQYSGNPNFAFDVVDLSLQPTGLKSGTENMQVTLSGGILGTGLNYAPFGLTDYWYWGYGLGKCDNFSGYLGQDATTQLQYKFRHPIAVPAPGYFVSVVQIDVVPGFDPEFDDPEHAPYDGYMIYCQSGTNNEFDQCLSPDDLNYYLSKFDFIRNTKTPPFKQYKTVEVIYTLIPQIPDWTHLHIYHLYYGVKIDNPGN